jgi:hypothetical protein
MDIFFDFFIEIYKIIIILNKKGDSYTMRCL